MTIQTVENLQRWIQGCAEDLGDPSAAVCSLVFRWMTLAPLSAPADLVCGMAEGQFVISLDGDAVWPLPIVAGDPEISEHKEIINYGAECIAKACGVWILSPSLNIPGLIHGYVTLVGVPSPAPWEKKAAEQKIVIATEMPALGATR
jgi:hypothetical protein